MALHEQEEELSYERHRANSALDEAHALRKRLDTYKQLLHEMRQKKRKWQRRARIAKKMADVWERRVLESKVCSLE